MAKDKIITERTIEVEMDGKKEKFFVKRPGNRVSNDSQRKGALVWTQCVREGVMTKKELKKYMIDNGIWDDGKDEAEKNILNEILDLEKELYLGTKVGKMKASDGKDIAIKMRVKRGELRDLLAERVTLESNTAEGLSDNARFDYIVAHCTYNEDGTRVYKDLDDYDARSDSDVAFQAASALAEMIYVVDKDFENKLPENKFLTKYEFVNDELSLIDKKGTTVDTKGRRINSEGHYLDEDGKRVDVDGNLLDEDANYVSQVTFLDDNGNPISDSKTKKPAKLKRSAKAKVEPKENDETES